MIPSSPLFCTACGAANQPQAKLCWACSQPVAASPEDSVPTSSLAPASTTGLEAPVLLAQRYRIVGMVGKGGYGAVYKAEDTQRNNSLIAIKSINLSHLSSEEIIEATDTYNREVSLLSTLKHANLPHIYDHFTAPDHWYLVMDFIAGETLENYLHKAKKGYLRVREVLTIGIQLCTVLDYLHTQKQPIIFRDVKPANVMRMATGQLYLIDFGIARRFRPGQKHDTTVLGSPGYAAPEQYGKAQTTAQTDIYGLGATLQTLLIGANPLETAVGGPSSMPPRRIPKKLHQLLNQMLEPDASKRPQSMDEVKRCLQQIKWGIARDILTTIRPLLPFFWGLLIGSMPYVLIISLLLLVTLFSHYGLDSLALPLAFVLLASLILWPFVFIGQLIAGIRFLFSPRKRLMGLGILAMQVFLIIGILLRWIPSPLSK